MITDHQRLEFMRRLASDVRGKNGLLLPEWESNFLASFLQSSRPSLWFTEGRRTVVDRMWMRFGPDIHFPHPLDTIAERPKMAPADSTGCEYLVKGEDGRQHRCNEPATCQEPRHLRYCDAHGQQVEQAMKRMGKTLALIKFP